jgi:intracellular septation protein A
MKDVFAKLAQDFLSTIVFLALYLGFGNVLVATAVAIAAAIAQLIYARIKGETLDVMTYGSLALVIVLGGTTLWTHDPRFVLAKPSIGHFAIGFIMLRRGWMLRYLPGIVRENAPDLAILFGYGWAVLMFALGLGNLAVAATGDMNLWAFYITGVAIGAKVLAFVVQYVVLRVVIARRIRAARAVASL